MEERISVVASFGLPYKIRPVRFRWAGREKAVREITYQWTTREGSALLYHFAVTDGASAYEMSFNSQNLIWLMQVSDE
ncbi:hypothetical protein ACFLZI_03905 [Nitrospirota bacterium]